MSLYTDTVLSVLIIHTTGSDLRRIDINSDERVLYITSDTDEMLIIDIDHLSPTVNTQIGSISVGESPTDVVIPRLPAVVAYVINNITDELGTVSVIN